MHHNKTLFEFWQKNKHGNCSVFIKTNDDLVNVSYLQMALYGHLVKYSDHNFIAICIKHPKNWKLEIGSIKKNFQQLGNHRF